MKELYPSLKPLPKPIISRLKEITPKGQVTKSDYEARVFKSQFKKQKTN